MDGMLGDREQGGEYLWDNETSLAASVTLACFMPDWCDTHSSVHTRSRRIQFNPHGKTNGASDIKKMSSVIKYFGGIVVNVRLRSTHVRTQAFPICTTSI